MTNKILKRKPLSVTQTILYTLADLGRIPINAFFPKYKLGTGPVRTLVGLNISPRERQYRRAFAKQQKQISRTLSHLAQQGLVAREGSKKKSLWSITQKGQKYLRSRKQIIQPLPPEDGLVRLVMFDIPETHRKNRDWLRPELRASGFEMIQRSVWIGKRPIPAQIIEDIKTRKLISYIHIVEINKKGTLTELL